MNFTLIFGVMAVVGAVGLFWWGLTRLRPWRRPAPTSSPGFSRAPERRRSNGTIRPARIGHASRLSRPARGRPGLKLGQAGQSLRAGPAPILGIKAILARGASLLVAHGRPRAWRSRGRRLGFFLPDYGSAMQRDKRQGRHAGSRLRTDRPADNLRRGRSRFRRRAGPCRQDDRGAADRRLRRTIIDIRRANPRQALRRLADRVRSRGTTIRDRAPPGPEARRAHGGQPCGSSRGEMRVEPGS